MAVVATLNFDNVTGGSNERIRWELDIIETSHVGAPISLIGSGTNPITITWHKDRDVYKPIVGSSAEINLVVPDATHEAALPDFNAGRERQYEVRLRYRDNNGDLQPFWCGYIDPVASREQFTTYPYDLTFKCTDGLGRLEQLTLDRDSFITGSDPAAQIPVWTYVSRTLRQTGLELPIYVESGIRTTSGDALTTSNASAYSFFGEDISDRREAPTYKEALEGVLTTFNCRVFQSAEAWWVVNCSTHGGSGQNEQAVFQQWTPNTGDTTDYSRSTDVTHNLRFNLDGTDMEQVTVVDEDWVLNTRRPVGSVEARPEGLIQRPLHSNDDFRNLAQGWQGPQSGTLSPWSGTLPSGYVTPSGQTGRPLTFAPDSLSDPDSQGNAYSIVTNRNRQIINSLDELWFQSTSGFPTNAGSPTNIAVRWKYNDVNRGGRDPVGIRIPIRIRVDLDAPITVNEINTSSIGSLLAGPSERTISTIYWNFNLEEWDFNGQLQRGNRGNAINGTMSNDAIRGGGENEWQDVSITVAPYNTYSGFFDDTEIPGGTMYVEFFLPQSTRNGRKVNHANADDEFDTFVDSVVVSDDFDSDVESPVYEHVAYTTAQRTTVTGTRTLTYNPGFVSSGPNTWRQYLAPDLFWRTSETQAEATSLEQKITLQKLNDFSERFQYFEGSLINRTKNPLQMHNKVLVNYASQPNTVSSIMNGGTFNPKMNKWDAFIYQPNNANDIDHGRYFEHNVDLIASLFQGRSNQGVYVLGLDVRGLDDMGGQIETVDSEGRMPGTAGYVATYESLVAAPPFIRVQGAVGVEVQGTISINPGPGYEASASNLSILDMNGAAFTDDTRLDFVEFGDIQQSGRTVEIPYTVTIPRRAEYEQVRIQGETDPFSADNRDWDITFALDSSVTNASISTVPTVRGPQESVSYVQAIISPSAGHELDHTSFTVVGTLPTGVTLVGFQDLGFSVSALFAVTFQSTDQSATITLNGDAATAITGGLQTSSVTLTINESDADGGVPGINNVSLSRTSLTVSGFHGQVATYNLLAYAADGYELNSGNFSVMEPAGGIAWLDMQNASGGGDFVLIPLEITFPTTDSTGTITVNGSAQEIGAATTTLTVNFTNNIANTTLTDSSETFILNPGQRIAYANTLTVTDGYQLSGAPAISETGDDDGLVDFSFVNMGGDVGELRSRIIAPAADDTVTITLTGNTVLEPYRFIVTQDTSGLNNASANFGGINQPFDRDDAGNTFTRNYSVAGVGNYAFMNTDTITVSSGDNISTTTPTFSGGIWSFTATLTYPTVASGFYDDPHEFFSSITISGTPSAVDPLDDLIDVTLNFIDSVDNGAPQVPSITLSGAAGTTATYYAVTVPDGGYRVTAGNITTTDTSAITAIGTDQTRGLNVVTPITVSFPSTNSSVQLTVDGDATAIGVATNTYTLTVAGTQTGTDRFTIPDWTSANPFTGVPGATIEANVFVQSNAGYEITSVSSSGTVPAPVTVGSTTIIGDGAIVPIVVTIPTSSSSGTLNLTVNTQEEPYEFQINLTNNVTNTMLSTSTLPLGFGDGDLGQPISASDRPTFTIQSNASDMAFTAANQVTTSASGGLSVSYSYSSGVITGTISGTYPSTAPDTGIQTVDLEVNPGVGVDTGSPPIPPASSASIVNQISSIPGAGGTVSMTITANGMWRARSRGRSYDGRVYDIAGSVIGNIAPFQGGPGTHEISVSAVALSAQTNGDSLTSSGWQLDIEPSNSTTRLATTQVTQSRNNTPEVRFVSSLPATEIASVMYIYPDS